MPAALVDVSRPAPRATVQLAAVRLPALDKLVRPVAHALLPGARLERSRVRLQAFRDLAHAPSASEVGAEPRPPVVNDVGVGVVEAGQHARARQADPAR